MGASILLTKAIGDDDLRVQSGFLGWSSLLRGRAPGHRRCYDRVLNSAGRHPIYMGPALCVWVGPVLTFGKLLLGSIWSS